MRSTWFVQCGILLLVVAATGVAHAQEEKTTPASAPTPAPAPESDEEPRQQFRFGPDVHVFLPTSDKTRDRFGSTWTGFGLGAGAIRRAATGGRKAIGLDFGIYRNRRSKGDGRALFIPLGVNYRRSVGGGTKTAAYVGTSVNLNFVSMRSDQDNVSPGIRTGVAGSVLAGVAFGGSGFLEGRYLVASKVNGFDLSGVRLSGGIRF